MSGSPAGGLDQIALTSLAILLRNKCEWGDCARDPVHQRCDRCQAAASLDSAAVELEALRTALRPPTSEELLDLGECAVRGYLDFEAAREWFVHRAAKLAPRIQENVVGGVAPERDPHA